MSDAGTFSTETNAVIDGESFAAVHATRFNDGTVAITAVHRMTFGHRLGGTRFVEGGAPIDALRSEVAHLASAMTWKSAAARLPFDGMKTIVAGNVKGSDDRRRADILAAHLRHATRVDAGIIAGPDMGYGEPTMDLVAESGLLANVSGLSLAQGGLSIDERGYTAFGLAAAVEPVMRAGQLGTRGAVIQGFGAVGAHVAAELAARGVAVTGVSNVEGTLVGKSGLDVARLMALRAEHGDGCLRAMAGQAADASFTPDPMACFTVPCDVFVPAARTSIGALEDELAQARRENPWCLGVERWHATTTPLVILEGANHPFSPRAEEWLEAHGTVVLPDYIVNAGGLIGCVFEWAWRDELRADRKAWEPLDARCRSLIRAIIAGNVARLAQATGGSRKAAHEIALSHLGPNREALGPGQPTVASVRRALTTLLETAG